MPIGYKNNLKNSMVSEVTCKLYDEEAHVMLE